MEREQRNNKQREAKSEQPSPTRFNSTESRRTSGSHMLPLVCPPTSAEPAHAQQPGTTSTQRRMSQHNERATAPPPRHSDLEFVHPSLVADSALADQLLLRQLSLLLLRADDLDEVAHPDIDSDFAVNALADWRDEARELLSSVAPAAPASASAVALGAAAIQHLERLILAHQQHQQAAIAAACHKTYDAAASTATNQTQH